MNTLNEKVKISVYKYNKKLHYSWDTYLIESTDEYILVRGESGRNLNHYTKNKVFKIPTQSLEYFSLTEGFTVNIDIYPNGDLEYYCNIALPAEYKDNIIRFIDLDIDIVKRPGEDWKIVDYDEFLSNSRLFKYPDDIVKFAEASTEKLQDKIRENTFPFNGFFDSFIKEIVSK